MKYLWTLLFFVFISCTSEPTSTAGTATDTGNTIAGYIETSTGEPANQAFVRMIARSKPLNSFSVNDFIETQTDSVGFFSFDTLLSDTFNLEVRLEDANILTEMIVLKSLVAKDFDQKNKKTIQLQKPSYIKGFFEHTNSEKAPLNLGSHFTLQIEGTSFEHSLLSGEPFIIGVGVGLQNLKIYPADPFMINKIKELGISDSMIYQQVSFKTSKGDTLNLDTLRWEFPYLDSIADTATTPSTKAWLQGSILDMNGKPKAGAEVRLIDDIYGFRFAKANEDLVKTKTTTNEKGLWTLALDEVPEDSFRVEIIAPDSTTAVSNYLHKNSLKKQGDTLKVNEIQLKKPSAFLGLITLVANPDDPISSKNCILNSIIVGFKGTSHFVRQITCYSIYMSALPAGPQELVFYTADFNILEQLKSEEDSLTPYLQNLIINLPENDILSQQGITYTPPTKAK